MSKTIHQQMRRKAAQPNPFDSPSGRYVVVAKSKFTDEMEPVHPGHIDKAAASGLSYKLKKMRIPCEVWTDEKWNKYDDQIRAEVFCPECGEERVLCKCEAKEAK